MADEHGRDNVGEIELALDADNKFVALRLNMLANIGAYVGSDRNLLSPFGMIGTVLGVYLIPKAYLNVVGVLSNTNPTAPYRGAGRPEAIYLIERLIDDAARELGVDRVELRRKNMLGDAALPYQSPVGPFYDCGEFEKNMDMALKLADVAGYRGAPDESKKRGKLRGLGIINAIEQAAGTAQPEYAEIRFNPGGTAALLMGTKAQGQGHETMFKQILNERLGHRSARRAVHRRRHRPRGLRHGHQRLALDGAGWLGAVHGGREGDREGQAAGRPPAGGGRAGHRVRRGHLHDEGHRQDGVAEGGRHGGLQPDQVAQDGFEGGLYENATFLGEKDTYPNGCHICEVEVDPDTGEVKLERYAVVDDVGTVMNPIGPQGPDPWRRGAGRGPDPERAGRSGTARAASC